VFHIITKFCYESVCCAVAQAVSCRPLTAKTWVCTWVSPRRTCGGQSDTWTGFSLSSSVFSCQYHITMALHTRIIWGSVFQPVVRVSPGVHGRFRWGALREIKNLKLLFYHFLYLSLFNLFIVCMSTVCVLLIIKFVCHTIITEFVFCLK
jgi:hypothetical protein